MSARIVKPYGPYTKGLEISTDPAAAKPAVFVDPRRLERLLAEGYAEPVEPEPAEEAEVTAPPEAEAGVTAEPTTAEPEAEPEPKPRRGSRPRRSANARTEEEG